MESTANNQREDQTNRAKKLEEFNIEEKKAETFAPLISPSDEMNPQTKNIIAPSTQNYLDLEEIHNGVVILKNGGLRMVLMVSAINFSLKSEEEQNAIIYSFQGFLNSLSFPIQIVMQSRRLDLSSYLAKLKSKNKSEENPLIRLQMTDYIGFVEQLLKVANIMEKKFYVVVPYQPIIIKKENILQKTLKILSPGPKKTEIVDFEMHRKELVHRTEVVAAGLGSVGLRAVQLNTLELAELYYSSYNPELATRQKIASLADITTPIVEKSSES
ncbi:hypothetical protein KJ713_01865 [Patescibacteria group bacterium]|nr:hypothetical protein [Patescibacteria group bacterium]